MERYDTAHVITYYPHLSLSLGLQRSLKGLTLMQYNNAVKQYNNEILQMVIRWIGAYKAVFP